jgi:Protein of unknown function (DUF3108)
MPRLVAVILALALLTAWPSAEQRRSVPPPSRPPRVEQPVPFRIGETLTFDISWSALLTAGTAVATVTDKRPSSNSTAYYIVVEGRPTPFVARLYPLYYKIDTLLDAFTLLPQRGSVYAEEGGRRALRTTTFDRGAQKASFEHKGATTVRTEFPVPPGVQDVLSVLYAIRAMPLSAGRPIMITVSNDGLTYPLRVDVAAPERVKTVLGELGAWRLSPGVEDVNSPLVGRNLEIWLSDDARRLPVRMRGDLSVGAFVLTLREVK